MEVPQTDGDTSLDQTAQEIISQLKTLNISNPSGEMSKNVMNYFIEMMAPLFHNPKMNINAYLNNPTSYTSQDIHLMGMIALCNNQLNELHKLTESNALLEEKNHELEDQVNEYKENYEEVVEDANRFKLVSPKKADITDLEVQLNDTRQRLAILQQKYDEDLRESQLKIEDLTARNMTLMDASQNYEQTELTSLIKTDDIAYISAVLGVPEANTADEIISEIQGALDLPKSAKNLIKVMERLVEDSKKLETISREFRVSPDSPDIAKDIRDKANNEVTSKLQQEFQVFGNHADPIDCVSSLLIQQEKQAPVLSYKTDIPIYIKGVSTPTYIKSNIETQTDNDGVSYDLTEQMATTYRAQVSQLKQQVEENADAVANNRELERKNKALRTAVERSNGQLSEMRSRYDDEKRKRQAAEDSLNNLRELYAEAEEKIDEQEHQINTLKEQRKVDEEVRNRDFNQQKLHNAFELMMAEQTAANNDIKEIARQRDALATLTEKYGRICDALESRLSAAPQKEAVEADTEAITGDLINSLVSLDIDGVDEEVGKVLEVLRSKEPYSAKLQTCFEILLEADKDGKDAIMRSEGLSSMLSGQLRYIEVLASGDSFDPSIRRQLVETVEQAHIFLERNCSGLIEENGIFDLLDFDADPLELKNGVLDLIEKFPEVEAHPDTDAMLLLRQSLAVVSTLRRYSQTAQEQFARISNEVKQLRTDRENANAAIENLKDDLDRALAEREKAQKDIENIRQAIAAAGGDDPNLLETVNQIVDGNVDNYATDRIHSLENELKEAQEKLQEKSEAYDRLLDARQQLQDTQRDYDEQRKQLTKLQNENDRLREENANNNANIRAAAEKEKKLKTKLEAERRNNAQLIAETSQMKVSLQGQINKLADAMNIDKDDQLVQKGKEIAKLQNDLEAEKGKTKELTKALKQTNKRATDLRQSDAKANSDLIKLRAYVKDLEEKINAAEIENKALEARCNLQEDRFNAERQRRDSREKLAIAAAVSSERVDRAKIEKQMEEERSSFIRNIFDVFAQHADLTAPLDSEHAADLLVRAGKRLDQLERNLQKNIDADRQMKEIADLLKPRPGVRLIVALKERLEEK